MIRERAAATLPGLLVLLVGLLALGFLIYALVTQAFGDSPGILITAVAPHPRRVLRAPRRLRRQSERGPRPAVLRRLRRHGEDAGTALGQPVLHEEAHLAARAQLREHQAQGQRPRGQPDRDRRRRRLARRRHRRGGLRGRRLSELREGADRGRGAQPRDELQVRRARGRSDVAARQHRGGGGTHEDGNPGSAVEGGRRGARGAHQPPGVRARRLRRRCSSVSRPARSSRPGSGSSKGAVGMVEMALDMLSQRDILELDNERKAAMVSNLLVVLCGERATQPIINTGTIYQ